MALPPGGIPNPSDGDKKRLMQRADSFAIGKGTQEKTESDEIEDFDEAMESVLHKSKKVETEVEDERAELAKHRDDHAQMEAERRGSTSPSHQPLLGLSILPGITNPSLAVGQSPESHSKRRSGAVEDKQDALVEAVSPEVLQGLRNAGLPEPIVTLDDPRTGSASDRLNEHFVLSLRGNERVYVWSQNHCHQVLSIGLHESQLESAVGTTVETVRRRGKTDEKTIRSRPEPAQDFTLD